MGNQRRIQWVIGSIAAFIVALTACAYLLLARDTAPADDSDLRPEVVAVPPADNGFPKLLALGQELEQLATGSGHLHVPETYDQNTKVVADALLDRDLVRQLSRRLEAVLASPAFQGSGDGHSWAGVLNTMKILRLRMQRELFRGERADAWRTASLGLGLGRVLQERAGSFRELSTGHAVQNVWVKSIEMAMDADQWSPTELSALVSLPEAAGLGERLLHGMRAEYAAFQHQAESQAAAVSWLKRPVLYQANRSRRAWLEALRPALAALRSQDLQGAHRALTSTSQASDAAIRNGIGARQVATSIVGLALPVRQAIDATAQVRLLRVRAAMALYRLQQGRWPERLAELAGRQLEVVPKDPWSTPPQDLRYLARENRIYSVGPNQRDDQGRFNEEFSYRGGAQDYGVRLPTSLPSRTEGGARDGF